MPHLHEADAVLPLSQQLHDAVNAIARQPEDGIDTPLQQAFHHAISGSSSHGSFPDLSGTESFKEQQETRSRGSCNRLLTERKRGRKVRQAGLLPTKDVTF